MPIRSRTHATVQRLARNITIAIVPGVFTLVVVVASYFAMRSLTESRWWVDHTRKVIQTSAALQQGLGEAEAAQREYLLTADSAALGQYVTGKSDVQTLLDSLRYLTTDNPAQQARLATLDTLVAAQFAAMQRTIDTKNHGIAVASSAAFVEEGARKQAVRDLVGELRAQEEQQFETRDAERIRQRAITYWLMFGGGVLAVVVSLIANRLLARTIMQLGHANEELAEQAERLEEQATELETQATELEATATELEAANVELEEQAAELESQRDSAQVARADAEQANAAKSRFLSTMSHELRTPLNAVTGYVDLMDAGVHGPVTEAQREDIRRIKRAVSQLTSVINDILNFAKLEAGEVRLEFGLVYMSEALANASALMEPQAAAKNVRFLYTLCDPSITAYADRERVQQVVLNLLSNAVKYTEPGGDVRLSCARDEHMIYVSVSDTGRGISEQDMERIFSPFVQLLSSTHSPSDGVGLGLAIGRDLARAMGGDITATSTVGKGSVFTLTLPVAKYDREQSGPVTVLGKDPDGPRLQA